MPTFTITPSTTEIIEANSNGYAEVIYTVTNTSARPVRGIAKVKALDQTKLEWLKIKGEVERDFSPGATQQFIVAFEGPVLPASAAEKPKTAAAQNGAAASGTALVAIPTKYPFRLDIAVATKMEEDFTEGPVVTVKAAIGAGKTKFPFWIIPVIAVVVIGIGVGIWLLIPSTRAVPNVIGKPLDEAKAELEKAKLVAVEDQVQITNTVAAGQVIDQSPKEGEKVKKGTEVKLTIEGEEPVVQVPDVVRRLVNDAKQKLVEAGLTPVTTATPLTEGFQPNMVVSQKPGADQQVAPGSEVELAIAAEKVVQVPDVRFNPLAVAKQKLGAVGLTAEELPPELADASVAPGNVKSQSPDPGVEVPPNSTIKLIVAAVPAQVPPLKDKKIAEAQFLLQQQGLEMVVFGTYNETNAGTVLITGQTPAAFTNVARGSRVTVHVPCRTFLSAGCRYYLFEGLKVKTSITAVQPKTSVGIQPKISVP